MAAIALEVHHACPKCASPVPINGLVPKLTCGACQAELDNPLLAELARPGYYVKAFDVLRKIRSGGAGDPTIRGGTDSAGELRGIIQPAGRTSVSGKISWQDPVCPRCETPLPVAEQLEVATAAGRILCPRCGEEGGAITVRRVPRELVSPSVDFVTHVIGEDPDLLPGPSANVAAPAAAKPVLFLCPACNASLPVNGSSRTVECSYCHASVYLPDELWRRLHPARRIGRWYLWVREDSPTLRAYSAAGRWANVWMVVLFASMMAAVGTCGVGLEEGTSGWITFGVPSALAVLALAAVMKVGIWHERSGHDES